jgi:peptidoglycan/LPS O-acetylase OafA/YrhL
LKPRACARSRATPPADWLSLVPDALQRLGVDGWFPLFPWLGFALFGVLLERWRRQPDVALRPDARLALLLMAVGGLLWWLAPGPLETRKGYSELFYPPTMGYIVTAAGLVLGLVATSARWGTSPAGMLLQPLGRCSLFLYLAHLMLLELVWHPLFGRELELGEYLSATCALAMLVWVLAAWLAALKTTLRDRGVRLPGVLAFLLGG